MTTTRCTASSCSVARLCADAGAATALRTATDNATPRQGELVTSPSLVGRQRPPPRPNGHRDHRCPPRQRSNATTGGDGGGRAGALAIAPGVLRLVAEHAPRLVDREQRGVRVAGIVEGHAAEDLGDEL